MNPPVVGDDVYIARHMGQAFLVVEVRENKRFPYVLQHRVTLERMAFSLGELAACPTGETFRVELADVVDSGAFKYGRTQRRCEHQWYRRGINRYRRVERQACAVVGCVQKRNVALLDCPACVDRLVDGAAAERPYSRDAAELIRRRAACHICRGDGLIAAPKECRCCGDASKSAMCGPCLGAHGYRSVVHCERATVDERRLDEVLSVLEVRTARSTPAGRRIAAGLEQ